MDNDSTHPPQAVHLEFKPARKGVFRLRLEALARRLLDISVAALVLLVLGPFFLLISLLIRRDSPGPAFYRGPRLGLGGKEFGMLKFRTMYSDGRSANGAKVTAQDDSRITPLGKWLRETKINELPQFWNVLVGEMSLVGPRPEDPEIVRTWSEEERQVLLSVRPGITSPATVLYRDEEALLSASNVLQAYLQDILPTKLRMDMLYVRNRSLTSDLDVLLWTAISLLPRMRQRAVPQHALYWGPVSRLSRLYLNWLVIDSLVALLALGISGGLWRLSGPLDVGWGKSFLYALGIGGLFSLMNWIFGLNRVEWSRAPASEVFILGISTSLATAAVLALNWLNPFSARLPVAVIIIAGVLALFGFITVRYRERLITAAATRWLHLRGGLRGIGERVLIVGAGENGSLASWLFEHTTFGQAFSVVGMVDDDPHKQGRRIDGYDILGMTGDIPALVQQSDIGLIIYTIEQIQPAQQARILALCQETGARVMHLPGILTRLRTEMRSASPEEHAPQAGGVLPVLDELSALLAEQRFDEAQACLKAFRQTMNEQDRQS